MNKRMLLTVVVSFILWPMVYAKDAPRDAIPVYIDRVKLETVRQTLPVRGRIVAPEHVDVFSTFGGDVVDLTVDEGDRVRRGQILIHVKRIDPGVHYEPERVDSPLSGTITHRYISPGARVTPQTKLFEIVHDDSMVFRADILEVDLPSLRVGLTGTLRLTNGQFFDNVRLRKILPYVDEQRQVVPGEVVLPNPDHRLLPNSVGELELLLDQHQGMTVPRDAVVERKRIKGLFVVRTGKASWMPVTIIADLGDRLEIRGANLQGGDAVVTFGQNSLEDGAMVIIREDLRR
ncbi:MAG: efflux RND transporter periplasmic adaptor subunit [bacterium]